MFFGSMSKPTPARDAGFFMPAAAVRPLDNDIAELLGVCRDCHVKHPTLARDTHSGKHRETAKDLEPSTAAKKAERRNDRKKSRLERALDGEFTPCRRSAA